MHARMTFQFVHIIHQVNIFNCGGIGLSTSVVHKLFDGHTYFLFIKAWAAATRGSPKYVFPSFVASQLFPSNPNFNYSWPSKFY
ncbi:putative salutaridinol 7-O-acetyltransferase [Helianthus debilis subsp. tardiflorus]